jgi:hypothetical protein
MRQPVGYEQARAQRDQQDVVGIETEAGIFHGLVCTQLERRCNRSEPGRPAIIAELPSDRLW